MEAQQHAALGDVIREARGSRGQEWLADTIGVAQPTVSDWERGRRVPRPDKFPALEDALGLERGTLARIHYGEIGNGEINVTAPTAYDLLSPENRSAVDAVIHQLLRAQGLNPRNADRSR